MKIAVVHNAVPDIARPDETDVYAQVKAVTDALEASGHETLCAACTLDLSEIKETLLDIAPDVVFNLVESIDGQDRLIHLFPSLLDALNLPYTGSSGTALYFTSNKILAKARMQAHGIPTPACVALSAFAQNAAKKESSPNFENDETWLIKSVWEHASAGIDEDSLMENMSCEVLMTLLEKKSAESGKEWFAEQYIDGREFNVSIIAGPTGPRVLPPAEIIFTDFPENKPRIVGYRAKWEADSFEYQNTSRSFDFSRADVELLENLKKAALRCWHIFELSGYARVDFRVDALGRPWALEINANPCLSPDAGFAAALARAGIDYGTGVQSIIDSPVSLTFRKVLSNSNTPAAAVPDPDKPPSNAKVRIDFRHEARPEDIHNVETMTRETGFFREDEIRIAVELVEERLSKGPESGYFFVFAMIGQKMVGYTCYGPVPCTLTSFDLYWIAVYPEYQNQGIGKRLLDETERLIKKSGGLRVYIETSHKDTYESTRSFYIRCGYTQESLLEDFYSPGDAKATYCKTL